MLTDEEFDRALRDADPLRGAAPDPGPVLARARRAARRTRTLRLVAVPAVALVVTGATAATYAWVGGDGHGHPLDSTMVICEKSSKADGSVDFDAAHDDPVQACRSGWKELFHEPAPARLSACVVDSKYGSIKVVPGGQDQCAHYRSSPYVSTTRDQRNLALLRADLKHWLTRQRCVSYAETRRRIVNLLAEHHLKGWTVHYAKTPPGRSVGPCAEIGAYIELDRSIWLADHKPGDVYTVG